MDDHIVLRAAMHLRMGDLANWRTVDTTTKNTLDAEGEENAWRYCAQALLFTSNRLFAPYSLYASSQRQLCFKFHSLFQRANYMLSTDILLVEDLEEATLIERRLREAFSVCSAHRAASGRDAQVLMGSFCVRGAKETMFQFGAEGMSPTVAGLPPGVLVIKLCVQESSFMTWAAYGEVRGNVLELNQEAARKQLTFNVSSADCEVSIAFEGIPLVLDGRWRSWRCSTSHCRSSETYSDWPILCAVSLLEAESARPRQVDCCSAELISGPQRGYTF